MILVLLSIDIVLEEDIGLGVHLNGLRQSGVKMRGIGCPYLVVDVLAQET